MSGLHGSQPFLTRSTRAARLAPRTPAALAVTVLIATLASTPAWAQGSGWRFQFGLTAVSGMSDFGDKIETNNPSVVVSDTVPLGLAFAAYHQSDSGWAAGVTIGPAILAVGDVSLHVVPVGLEARYRFSNASSSPYVRLGVEKASAGGDFVKAGNAGGAVAIGMDFGKPAGFGWGFEIGYRSVEVIVKATPGHREAKVQPYKGTLSAYIAF